MQGPATQFDPPEHLMSFLRLPSVLSVLAFLVLLGCSGSPTDSSATTEPEPEAPEPGTSAPGVVDGEADGSTSGDGANQELDEATRAALAKADAADGSEDRVVGKCAGCALHMDGSADHPLEVAEYTLHLCSADCKKGFEGDLSASLEGLVATVNQSSSTP